MKAWLPILALELMPLTLSAAEPATAEPPRAAQEPCAELKSVEQEMQAVLTRIYSERAKDKALVTKLKAAQAAWERFRDAHMAARFPAPKPEVAYGSAYPTCVCQEKTEMSKARLNQLNRWTTGSEYDVCGGSYRP